MIRGIHHIAIHTPQLERMLGFYRDVIGFVEVKRGEWSRNTFFDEIIGVPGSAARTVMLRAGNCHLELFEYSAPQSRPDRPLRPCDHGYTHLCLDVLDIDAEHARLSGTGMTFTRHPGDFGNLKAVYGRDPDGNIVEIQETAADHVFAMERLAPVPSRGIRSEQT